MLNEYEEPSFREIIYLLNPSQIIKLYQEAFNYKDSYFIDTGEDLVSYKNKEALSVAILNKYLDCLEDFYYNDEDKFLKIINS